MHPINFDSYVTVRPPDCRNHRHGNLNATQGLIWKDPDFERSHVFFSLIFDVYTHMVRTGPEKSLKKCHVLEKSLKFPPKSLNIFESSLNKKNLHLKKEDLMFCAKE